MPVITPIRSDNSYFGFSKETTPGTPVAPSVFPRWMDGSAIEYDMAAENIAEGDGSRRLSLIVKNRQMVKVKLSFTPRPIELGFFEAAAMGAGSDTFQTGTTSTTLTASVTGGSSTSISLTAALGLTVGSGNIQLLVGAGTANVETATFTLPATGTGPYVLTVASSYNGGKMKNNHNVGDSAAVVDAISTSVTTATTVGATSINFGNNMGLTTAGTAAVVISPGTVNEEIAILNTPGTGTGPYTYTVAATYNGGALKNAHLLADNATGAATHILTDQSDGNYYTIEVGLGSLFGGTGTTLRVRDCKVETIKRSSKAGSILMYEIEWIGIACAVQVTPATITLEAHQPFLFTQGVWNIDGSTSSNDVLSIELWDIEQKNNLDLGIQTEQLTLAATIFGMLDVGLAFDVVFTNTNKIYQTYFGSTSGTADAQALGLGSFSVTFTQPDTLQSVTYTVLTLAYTKIGLPAPKKDGKHFKLAVSGTSIASPLSGSGPNNTYLLQTTVNNTQYASY